MNRRTTMSDDDALITMLLVVFFGPALVMAVIPGLAATVGRWLTEHHVLVPNGPAQITLPGLDAGLDLRRVTIAVLLLCATALTIWAWRARRDAT